MPNSKRTFVNSKMNKDIDERLIPDGDYRDALNIRVANSEGSDVGAIENSLSNKRITNIDLGDNAFTIGGYADEFEEKIYWFVVSDTGSFLLEWDNINQVISIVLKDTRPLEENVLNLNKDYLITGVNIIVDTDNGNRYLYWTDNINPPRAININRAKTYGENNFGEAEISVIKAPPLYSPEIELIETSTQQENFISERFISFAYRYKYLDGEYSALSPFTEYAFEAKDFDYDFNTATNESMVNNTNSVRISFNTGSDLVQEVDVVFKESGSNVVYVAQTFNKDNKGWNDDAVEYFTFYNDKIFLVLPERQLFRLYDAVPLLAKAQEVIGNRLVYGNYTENHDLLDCDGNPVFVDYKLSLTSEQVEENTASRTLKSIRDYELVMAYGDDNGRLTSGLQSGESTVHVPISYSDRKNSLSVELRSKAPCFAKFYRFYIKQSSGDFDTIIPTLFYKQSNFTYFLIENSEIDKVKEGDFLIIKADTQGLKNKSIKVKVLEVKSQDENFLSGEDGGQVKGLYFKVSFNNADAIFDENSYSFYEFSFKDSADGSAPPTEARQAVQNEQLDHVTTLFKGDTLNDIVVTANYTSDEDKRYEVEIFTTDQAGDTFQWRTQDVNGAFSFWNDNGGAGIPLSTTPIDLDGDVSISFNAITGHSINDKWLVKKNKGFVADEADRSYGVLLYHENITAGSSVRLFHRSRKEKSSVTSEFDITSISSDNYDNLEEWFYGEEIYNEINAENYLGEFSQIKFRKFNLIRFSDGGVVNYPEDYQPGDLAGVKIDEEGQFYGIIIESDRSFDQSRKVYSETTTEIRKLESLPIFETEAKDNDTDIYYEIGRTYLIDENGNHLGFNDADRDQDIVGGVTARLELPTFNAYCWGNGVESSKIKDSFNGNIMSFDTRPITVLDEYKRNVRIASLTHSGRFQQSTNYNALNEFNLSTGNFKDLDDAYGSIQKLYSRDNNIIAFQEDKIFQILFNKSVVYGADGTSTLTQTNAILGQELPFAGEYGISNNPESFAKFGNRVWFTDAKRGSVLRLSIDGITEVSEYGMRDYFRDSFRAYTDNKKIGSYDPYFDQYVLNVDEQKLVKPLKTDCGIIVYKSEQSEPFTYTICLNDLDGDVVIDYNITEGSANVQAVFNGNTYVGTETQGFDSIVFQRDTLSENEVVVTVTPLEDNTEYSVVSTCPLGFEQKVVLVIVNDEFDTNKTMTSRYRWGTSVFFNEQPSFNADGVTLFESYTGIGGQTRYPTDGSTIVMDAFKDITDTGDFNYEEENRIGYLVSNTVYDENSLQQLLDSANYPLPIQTNQDQDYENHRITFPFNKQNVDDILYLIWNYKSIPQQLACDAGVNASGGEGIYYITLNVGTDTGLTGINYNSYNVPDRFIIEYDNVTVADSKYVGNNIVGNQNGQPGLIGDHNLPVYEYNLNTQQFEATGQVNPVSISQNDVADGSPQEPQEGLGQLLFNKVTAEPTTMRITVIAPVNTSWMLNGICPGL